ncbi:TIGR03085 family metal-binding protein [uncultured Cellulomonas sp.]|uniref:TIGR03085 family metal-binding protein n=1 Tax=uncultured Cellulomonas sp. TaxID=189682 RepID=UPI00260A39E6|nr:TIGR03085 family metal-binding protein [uncultured Cellulomonas sp.]
MPWHPLERAALAHALREAGPDAPTLCEGWAARHLAAHVVLRETAPLAAAGVAVRPLGRYTERRIAERAALADEPGGWDELVGQVEQGPGRLSPMSWMGDAANLLEFFIHTEDVRRGAGPVPAQTLAPEHTQAIWDRLARQARLLYRRAGVGVVLVVPGGPRRGVRRPPSGAGTVVLRGEVGELALHAFGRESAARVDVLGHPDDVERLQESPTGI